MLECNNEFVKRINRDLFETEVFNLFLVLLSYNNFIKKRKRINYENLNY